MNSSQRRTKLRARRATLTVGCEVRHKHGYGGELVIGIDPKDRKRMLVTYIQGDMTRSIPVMKLRWVRP